MAPGAHIVKSPAITAGERRLLAVVMMGSAMGGDAPEPSEEALRQAIGPYGGRLERLADGSMLVVLKGDRQVATDQAAAAARCALALRALANNRPVAIAMGRADSTSKLPGGDVLDRAARLLSHVANAPGAPPPIALDGMSAGLLDARFDVHERGAGLVLCGECAPSQGQRTLLGRPTSYVGRTWELDALSGILDECIEEARTRAVVVIAEAGMGKSRLGAEFVRRVQARRGEVAIWIGRGDSLRAGATFDLLAQALRGVFGIRGDEPLSERWDKIRHRVAEHVPAGEQNRVAEFLGELVGAPFSDDGEGGAALRAARQDARLMSEQMRRAWLDFLQAETRAHPVLLVLEDLHWSDFGTVRFIDTALRDQRNQSWMVLALARPEVFELFPKLWAGRQNVQEIRLKGLGRKASERLVLQALSDGVGPQTMERLVSQADGNAFYLEELIRAAAGGNDTALPETVLAMAETRLARLPLEARRVLRAGSVFGEVCWDGGVVVLLGGAMQAETVGTPLAKLLEQDLLVMRPESRFPGERELMFRHALIREGAYVTLPDANRKLGHRLAGEWLEDHKEDDPMVLAGHFERGGDRARAARYYLRASEQAMAVLDLEATMARTGLGLGCAPPPELRIALLGIRCEASCSLRLVDVTLAAAEELMRSAPRGTLPWAQAMIAYSHGTLLAGRIGDLLAAIGLLRETDPAPEATGKWTLALVASASILDILGRIPEGTALEERCSAIVRSTEHREPVARFGWCTAIGLRASYAHDDPWRGLEHSDAIRAIFDAIGGEQIFLHMELFRGLNLWFLGAYARAERTLEGIAAGDDILGVVSSLRRLGLAWLRADRGALDEARDLAIQLSESGHAHHNRLGECRGRWALAEVLRRMGDLEAAEHEIQAALAMAVPLDHPGVLATLAALRLAQGRAGEALATAEDAMARYAAMGGCSLFRGAFVRLVHAEALHATGAHDAAARAIAGARARLYTIAAKIADPDYRTSFLAGVPENARTLALTRAWLGEPDAEKE